MPNDTLRIFADATAIVTGGASGIGRALAEELAGCGAEVVLADLQTELAEQAAAGIRARGGRATVSPTDVRDLGAMERLVLDTVARSGRLDYLFNNAGIGIGGDVSLHHIEDWDRIIDTNLRGVVHGIHAAYPIMRRQRFGHIVNTSSMAGLLSCPGFASYAATKHAVVGLSIALRIEAAIAGVRVSVLCPGVVRTPILDGGRYGKDLFGAAADERRRMWQRLRPIEPDVFARKTLDAVAKNRSVIIIPARWKLAWWLQRLCPALGIMLAERVYRHMLQAIDKRPI